MRPPSEEFTVGGLERFSAKLGEGDGHSQCSLTIRSASEARGHWWLFADFVLTGVQLA